MVIDFGNVTADSSGTEADCTIFILFSAILLKNDGVVVDGRNYSVYAGANYDNSTYIWVGEAVYVADVPSEIVSYLLFEMPL